MATSVQKLNAFLNRCRHDLKVVTYNISIMATSVQKLNAFLNSEINQGKLFYDRLEFNFVGSLNVPFQGHLKIVQHRRFRSDLVVIDDDFTGGSPIIKFNTLGVDSLNSAMHSVELSLKLDRAKLQNGLINPAALAQIADQPILSSFEAYPAQ